MSGTIRTTDSPTLRRMQQELKHCGDPVSVAKLLAIGMELLARDLGLVKSPPVLKVEAEPVGDDLDRRHPIRMVYKANGKPGYAIHRWSDHSQAYYPIGEIHTGVHRLATVHASRKELFAELRQQKEAQQS